MAEFCAAHSKIQDSADTERQWREFRRGWECVWHCFRNGMPLHLESQKETVKSLAEIGMAVEDIEKAMKVSVEQVQEWLSESESPAE